MKIQTAIINEGTPEIHRYAVKILKLGGTDDQYIKTYPFIHDYRNSSIVNKLDHDRASIGPRLYIGLGFTAYEYNNYLQVSSTYKLFPLDKGCEIIFCFEDGTKLNFEFRYDKQNRGIFNENKLPISDTDLAFFAENKLSYWQIKNPEMSIKMFGGFNSIEGNKQYSSQKSGQRLFMQMANDVLDKKAMLINRKYSL